MTQTFDGKAFMNALCGRPPDYKRWQEWYDEGNMDEVYNCWKRIAKEEEGSPRRFWRIIIEMIEYQKNPKNKKPKEADMNDHDQTPTM